MNLGTPKTLEQAIENAFLEWASLKDRHPQTVLKDHVRDFLSQHFGVAMLEHPDQEASLKSLFQRICGEKGKD